MFFYDGDEIFLRPRIYRDRINFNLDSTSFREAFRVDPPVVNEIERRIGVHIERSTNRSHALSVREQILITLQVDLITTSWKWILLPHQWQCSWN